MLDLSELEQLVAFADCGTLSEVAAQFHISQPTITRTMQHLEEAFGVPLFVRGKNKICLNQTGEKAVEYSRKLLDNAKETMAQVQGFHKSLHTITVESCAPAPLWTLLPILSVSYPDMTISSGLTDVDKIIEHVESASCDIGVIPFLHKSEQLTCKAFLTEALSICVLPTHEFADKKSITFSEMNGFNFLLRSDIGFWDSLCRKHMPASKFLIQTDDYAFRELTVSSTLPFFVTNLSVNGNHPAGRIVIPIADAEATVTYYVLADKGNSYIEFPAESRCNYDLFTIRSQSFRRNL